MEKPCFYCDFGLSNNQGFVIESKYFYVRFSDFPVSKGHCEIVHKDHKPTMFTLSNEEILEFNELLKQTKEKVDKEHKPDGYNIGVNEGKAAGQSQNHLHIHIIPRYQGDVTDPTGGVRNVIPDKGNYKNEVKERFPERVKYF